MKVCFFLLLLGTSYILLDSLCFEGLGRRVMISLESGVEKKPLLLTTWSLVKDNFTSCVLKSQGRCISAEGHRGTGKGGRGIGNLE